MTKNEFHYIFIPGSGSIYIPWEIKYESNRLQRQPEKKGLEYGHIVLETTFGECELMLCTDTLQYDDYDKYDSEAFDEKAKLKRHKEVFPEDCRKAFDLGVPMASRRGII